MWLDADDVLLPSDRQKLLALKAELDGTADVVMLPYHTGFDEQGRPIFFCYRKYNQDLTTGSLLIEIGGHGNTLEEALRAGEFAALALAELLGGQQP